MEIRVLRYFLAVAREENISGAAELLHITQPTLSRQLIELEEELGTKLFTRGSRKITLTSEGMLLRKRAEEIVSLVQKTESEFSSSHKTISGDLYIGGGETRAMRLIAEILKGIRNDYPDIRTHLFSCNADELAERLDKGLVDFGLLIGPADQTKYNYLKLPVKDTWGLLMRKDSPLAEHLVIRPEDLRGISLVSSAQTLGSNLLSNWLKEDDERLNLVATYNLVYNASLLVASKIGYALCLDQLVNTSSESSLCFRPLEPKLEIDVHLVWKKYQIFSKASELFLERMRNAYA